MFLFNSKTYNKHNNNLNNKLTYLNRNYNNKFTSIIVSILIKWKTYFKISFFHFPKSKSFSYKTTFAELIWLEKNKFLLIWLLKKLIRCGSSFKFRSELKFTGSRWINIKSFHKCVLKWKKQFKSSDCKDWKEILKKREENRTRNMKTTNGLMKTENLLFKIDLEMTLYLFILITFWDFRRELNSAKLFMDFLTI